MLCGPGRTGRSAAVYRFLLRSNESALHLAGSEDSYAELGGGAGRGSPEEFGASWRGTLRRGRWVRLCAFPVVCGIGGSEEPLGACGARSGVHFPCPLWALTRYTLGRTGTGSVSPQRWRGSCGDKGFRDVALRRGAAPGQAAEAGATQLCTGAGGDRVVACRGQGLGTP